LTDSALVLTRNQPHSSAATAESSARGRGNAVYLSSILGSLDPRLRTVFF